MRFQVLANHLSAGVNGERKILRKSGPRRIHAVHPIGLIVFLIMMCGCATVGPDFARPEAPVANDWIESEDPSMKTEPVDYSDWWTVFNDHVLDRLIETGYQQNLPLRIAGIRILEARAQLGVTAGNLYPQLQQARGAYTEVDGSRHAANTLSGDLVYEDYDVGFDAAWELDIWGKFRRGVESGVANLNASIANYDDIFVSLAAEVARTYVFIRTLENRLELARENVRIQERSLRIAEVRFEAGVVNELDVAQAKALLGDTKALIPRLEAGLRQAQNALSILLGMTPGGLDEMLATPTPIPAIPAEVAVGVPAELLRRRPDVRLAELRVATQSPQIGIAKADLYPRFTLVGSIGFRASKAGFTRAGGVSGSDLGDLFDSDSIEFFYGPSFSWDILNYGRIKNRVRVEDARMQQLVVQYQDTVLRAAQEVEDAMVAFLRTKQEAAFLSDSVKASKRSVELSLLQYREGLVDYQRVLDTQRFLTQQQDLETATRGNVAVNLIAMYKALGGGWQIRLGRDFVPIETKEEMRKRTDWGNLLLPAELEQPLSEMKRNQWRKPDW